MVPTLPVTFALLSPSEPGNVGAVARTLAAFAFHELCLIAPRCPVGHLDEVRAVRVGRELLRATRVVGEPEIPDFLAAHDEIWGTTARRGRHRKISSPADVVATYLARRPGKLLILFGPERDGLSAAWLDRCHRLLRIPTAAGPLNLAHAVTVVAYELRRQTAADETADAGATHAQRRQILQCAAAVLDQLAYPTRSLRRHPPERFLEPLRSGPLSARQARWLLGLLRRLEQRLGSVPGSCAPRSD